VVRKGGPALTNVPVFFNLTVNGEEFTVTMNATEHMAEYQISTGGSVPMTVLADLVAAAQAHGVASISTATGSIVIGAGNFIYHLNWW
jgi:hypothetical protein